MPGAGAFAGIGIWFRPVSQDDLASKKDTSARLEVETRKQLLDIISIFLQVSNYVKHSTKKNAEQVAKYADMFSAMGTEARLRIMQLLLSAHPEGLVVGEIQEELDIPNSTLSHHLDKLKNEGLVQVQRESTFLRYTANTEALRELMQFLYAECCTRNKALKAQDIVQIR
jgi:ArsR family transcriptional regulator, arsenate/arsenite/antimonite-responsive transcriptional repressor